MIQLQTNGNGKADGKPGVVSVPKRFVKKKRHVDGSVAFDRPFVAFFKELAPTTTFAFAAIDIGLKMAGQRLKGVRDPPLLLLLLLDAAVSGAAPTAINHIEFKMTRKNNMSERRD